MSFILCRWRQKSRSCDCGSKPGQQQQQQQQRQPGSLELSYKEVYDNPNYSHIMIGGQPFFILPSGELSGHVPVPRSPDTCAVQPRESHVYQHASSTYRSTSDYDTDSSTYRPESLGRTSGQQPIYEEIDQELELRLTGGGSVLTRLQRPAPGPALGPATGNIEISRSPVDSSSPRTPHPHTLSPRPRARVGGAGGGAGSSSSAIYYYSDTLRPRGHAPRHAEHVEESDSGISGEGTPQHHVAHVNTHVYLTNLSPRQKQNIVKL